MAIRYIEGSKIIRGHKSMIYSIILTIKSMKRTKYAFKVVFFCYVCHTYLYQSIMKIWHALMPNWVISVLLALIISLNLISFFNGFPLLSKVTALIVIPVLLVFYFYKQKLMATVFFTILMLAFLSILFRSFDGYDLLSKFSESSILAAYVLIIFVMLGKFKDIKFEGLVSWYLVLILLVNTYLMYAMFSSVKDSFQDSVILTLTVSRGVALLIMGFLAFAIYLSQESAQSILFLTVVCCFVFSDVLGFITTMYVDFWAFSAIHEILQATGLFLFVLYVYNHQQKSKVTVASNEANVTVPANHVTT